MRMARWMGIGTILLLGLLAACSERAQPPQTKVSTGGTNPAPGEPSGQQERAVKAIQKLGGEVRQDEYAPGRPVVAVLLPGTQVTDMGLKELAGLPQLKSLYLRHTQVTDAGLKELKDLKQLTLLDLGKTEVTDAGLKELKQLKQLVYLYLGETRVTNAGLKDLKDLKQLTLLDLEKTEVTDEGIKELEEALPNCELKTGRPSHNPRQRSRDNLKRIGLAFHNFSDANVPQVPANIYSKDGKPLLSWRVLLLPYLEQDHLFRKFKMDEPWDGPNNKKMLERIPAVYASVGTTTPEPYLTFYQGFNGPRTAFESDNKRFPPRRVEFGFRCDPRILFPASFPDGSSNTVLVVEAKNPVPWTKPEDLPYDRTSPIPPLGGLFPDGFHAVMADGSPRFISRKVSETTLRRAIERDDGQPLGNDW